MSRLLKNVAPRLQNAPLEYNARSFDDHNNILRLYFNQLDTLTSALVGDRGGRFLEFPYAACSKNADFTFTTANTAALISLDTADFLKGTTFEATDGIHVEQSGIYNYQYSIQFANTDSQAHNAWLWLKNGTGDIAGTGSKFDVPAKHGTSDGYLIAACNFYISLNAGDYVELWGAASQVENGVTDGVYLEYYAASTSPFNRPSIPSVVATLSFVSALST